MGLIDKETIHAEIERRLSNIVTGLDFTAEIELKGLLSFLDSIPPIQSLNRDHVARIIELWQDVEHDVEWCNEPSEFMYDEVLRRFNLDIIPEQPVEEGLKEELDFQYFAKELAEVYALPSSRTKNTEENPLNWEYEIARHFFELGLNARKEE